MGDQVLGSMFWKLGIKSTVPEDTQAAEKELDKLDDTTKKSGVSMANLSAKCTAAGAVMTGLGASIVLLTDSAKKTNAELAVTALQLGVSTEEMRDLALATTNVTFPLEEVTATMDLLTRAGMEDTEAIQETATALDTLGDATGNSASAVTESLIPALNAFNIPLEQAGEHTDTLTYLMRNSTIELSEFSSVVAYLAPDLDVLGLSLEDTSALMLAMADHGLQGSAATREFRTAVSAADGDITTLYESLGITTDEVANYSGKITDATGITDEYAAAANTQYGAVDELKQKFSELTLGLGSALEPLDGVGVAMTTFGGIMMGVGPMMTIFSGINLGTMVPSLMATATASWAVIAPWAPLIIAVGLVVGALWVLEDQFGLVTWAIDGLWSIGETLIDWITGAFSGGLDDGGESLLLFLGPIGWIIEAFLHWDEILPIITGVFTSVIDYIEGLFSWFGEAGGKIIKMLVDGILNSPLTPFGAISSMLGLVGDLLPHSPAKTGPLSRSPNWGAYLVDPLLSVEPAMQSAAVAAVSPVAAVTPGATSQTGAQNTDNSMSINQITFSKDADIAEFWRQRDTQITRNRVQRGIRI